MKRYHEYPELANPSDIPAVPTSPYEEYPQECYTDTETVVILPMHEQFNLDFSPEPEEKKESALETLPVDEIIELYKRKVGIDARFRGLSREEMLAGIADPTTELERIAEIDRKEDRNDLSAPYRKK